jgi:histone acetyltransferase (RNA polymerase elongator complex component)
LPDTNELREQIEAFLEFRDEKRTSVQIAYYGGNFLGLPSNHVRSLLSLAAAYVQDGMVDSIRFSTRPDTIDVERLEMLAGFPVETIELGAQSMDNTVLDLVNRGHSAEDTEEAVSLIKPRSYEIGLQMMIGLPGEDESSSILSANQMARLNPNFVRIYPAIVLKGSRLAEMYNQGQYTPLDLDEAIARVKGVYRIFVDNHIPVIRMGLQPTEDLNRENMVLAGPYHPSFGELVYQGHFFDLAKKLLEAHQPLPGKIIFKIHPKSVSKMRGHKNRNLKKLNADFEDTTINLVLDDAVPRDTVILGGTADIAIDNKNHQL